MQVEAEEEIVVKAKVVVVLEIRVLDSNSQMTHNNNNHTEVVEEVSLKAGGAEEDVAIRTDNNLDQILEIVIIMEN
jgi:predicted DNA binding protein